MLTRSCFRLPIALPAHVWAGRVRQTLTGLLTLWLAAFCLPGIAHAVGTATPAELSLAFNPTAVGVQSTQQLTASFAVTGANNPTAKLHYGIDYSVGQIDCTPTASGQTCTVPVFFMPTLPGARKDAVFLMDGAVILAVEYLGGVGQSPFALLQPGVLTPLVSGATYDQRESAVDENGTVYVLSPNNPVGSNVFRVTQAGVVSVVPVTVSAPTGIAIDGAGILYIPSAAPGSKLITWNTVTQSQGSVSAALAPPYPCAATTSTPEQLSGAAVDAFGDVYTLDEVCQSIIEVRPNGTTVVNAISPAMNADPGSIAVDSNGDVFVSCIDTINEQLTSGSQSAITNPGDPETTQLQVDSADALYVVPHPGSGVVELPAANYQSSQAAFDPAAVIAGIGLGSDGTLYLGNLGTALGQGNGNLDKADRSQGAIAFGQQAVGIASGSQQVAMYNGGNESLTISSVALTGSSAGFAIGAVAANGCLNGLVLASGAFCRVAVSLTPAHAGNLTGSIVFSTNSLNNADAVATVALSGFVPGSYATLSPSPVAFASQAPTTTSPAETVTLTNTGTVSLTDIVVSLTGANTADFAMATGANGCGSSLAVGASCSLYVTFTPKAGASYAAVLSVADGATNSPQTAALTGTGVPPPAILQVDEIIRTTDTPALGSSVSLNVAEIIHTSDISVSGSSVALNVFEVIHTTDMSAFGSSVALNIAEVVHTTDGEAPMLETPIALNIAEVISTTDTVMLTSTAVPTQTSLTSSVNPSVAGQTVTFIATVSSASGTPGGTVQFAINGIAAGSPMTLNAVGQAVYSIASLADGTSSIAAIYSGSSGSGSGSFTGSTSAALSQAVLDFAFTTSSSQSATISPGQSASYQFALAPQGAFSDTITFSVSGLPPGATASFNPASVSPGANASTVTMTLQTAQNNVLLRRTQPWSTRTTLLLGLLLPLCGLNRTRAARRLHARLLIWFITLGIGLAITGCGNSGSLSQPSQSFTLTVTATSGSLQHSTTVDLTLR